MPGTIVERSTEVVELSPPVTRFSPGAICLEGEFSRALSTVPTSSLDAMAEVIPEGVRSHGATIAYLLKGAMIADGSTYCGLSYSTETNVWRRPVIAGTFNSYQTMQLSSELGAEIFFGHWLLDGMCREIIAEDRSMGSLIHQRAARFHEPGYRQFFGLHPVEERVAHIENLWILDDRGVNDYKLARFSRLLERIERFRGQDLTRPEFVFLARRGGADRNLVNEAGVVDALERLGFQFIDCSTMSPKEIVASFSQARIVVSVEGSHQSHAVLAMPRGGALISIQPPKHVNLTAYRYFCDFKNIRQAFIIGEPREEGFHLDTDRLLRLIDLTLTVLSRRSGEG